MADSAVLNHQGDGSPTARGSRQRVTRRVLTAVAVACLAAGGVWYWQFVTYGRFQQTTDNAFLKADAVTVSPKIAGYVKRLFVVENQVVRAGQPLLEIDASTYDALADQNRAQIQVARATAEGVRGQLAEQRTAIARAAGDLQAAAADATLTAGEVRRYIPLVSEGVETREKLEQLRGQAAQAQGRLATARAALDAARRRVTTLDAQVRQAEAQGQAARAQLRSTQGDVGGGIVRASVDGRIGNSAVRTGQYVQAGTRLMSIVPVQRLYVEANFKETQRELMRIGQPVSVAVDALPDLHIAGRVASISPGTGAQFSVLPPQNATGNFTKVVQRIPVRIEIMPSAEVRALLVSGMSAEVTIDTRSARDARAAVLRAQERMNAAVRR